MDGNGPIGLLIFLVVALVVRWWRGGTAMPGPTGDLDAIRFDRSGWERGADVSDPPGRTWRNADGDGLVLNELGPVDGDLTDPDQAVELGRSFTTAGSGLVSARPIRTDAGPGVEIITKLPHGLALIYKGTLVVDTGDTAYMLTLGCLEHGTTGTREAIVSGMLIESGQLQLPTDPDTGKVVSGPLPGWTQDPYDQDVVGPALPTVSDDEQYDHLVPDHPLTRLRLALASLRESVRLESATV